MKFGVIACCVIFLVFAGAVQGEENIFYETYAQNVELNEEKSFHNIDITIKVVERSGEIDIALPPRAENLKLLFDKEEKACSLEEKEGLSILHCSFPEGIIGEHLIQISYESSYPIYEIQNQILYRSEGTPQHPTANLYYSLKLPKGFVIPEEKDVSFFINPKPKSIESDGQKIILLWEKANLTSDFELSVLMEPLPGQYTPDLTGASMLILALLTVAAFTYYLKKGRKKEASYTALIEQEKVVVNLLKKAEGRVLWQKQIQHKSGLSKVKVSRILRTLEERGVLRKESIGNTNKIYLILGEGPKESAGEKETE
jgi:uncharacterized membrane protein